jgi:predicted HTH transcriptional regulator
MNIHDLIKQPEGRRLEFKEQIPTGIDLAKTVVAFANDAGGEIFIGIKDKPREIIGLDDSGIIELEERVVNLIFDNCYPHIVPDISIVTHDEKLLLRILIHKGSITPYYIASKGKNKGTYIRVGSSTRLADEDIIIELERQKRNISFDSEILPHIEAGDLNLQPFSELLTEKTGIKLDARSLANFRLTQKTNNESCVTNALVLLSDGSEKEQFFPNAKIECARYKGTTLEVFLDQQTIAGNVAMQADEAYKFVLRNIARGGSIEGVYRTDRWEYPIEAIREAIRNAVVHRDYAARGRDIKVAIYDDMIEITSPGLIMPSINFDDPEAGVSDIRNKVLAPVFKQLGIIEQWGNGLKVIHNALVYYPEITFKWREPGLSLQLQFVKTKDIYRKKNADIDKVLDSGETKREEDWFQFDPGLGLSRDELQKVLKICGKPQSIQFIMDTMGWKDRTKFRNKFINPLLENGLLQMSIPDKPSSRNQKYVIATKGTGGMD